MPIPIPAIKLSLFDNATATLPEMSVSCQILLISRSWKKEIKKAEPI